MKYKNWTEINKLRDGMTHDPFAFLGKHELANGGFVIRAYMPHAESVSLSDLGAMTRIDGSDLFEMEITATQNKSLATHYEINWQEKVDNSTHSAIYPYSFFPHISDFDLHLFNEGKHHHAYKFLGVNSQIIDGVAGCLFAVWAPAVHGVSIVGDFNGWHGRRHPMRSRGTSGVWELFIPGLVSGDSYKYLIHTKDGRHLQKTDPYAQEMALRPDTVARVPTEGKFVWEDESWLKQRAEWDWQHQPMSTYEVHPGSWQLDADGKFLNYREMAEKLVDYVVYLGYTHIELLPITEHPLDISWGYQVSGYFAPTSRFGKPDDLKYLINHCHQHGIGVILDWVPSHFIKDDFALANFNGEALYEYVDPERGEHKEWGTLVFNYGRHEVRSFLYSSACYWLKEFHFDGLRVDAVASMLYLDYSRDAGQWSPNIHGGNEHLEAIDFLREFNEIVHQDYPGALTIAEESTAWPQVSRPTWSGGLGFSMKWNLGWMHDTLAYFSQDPVYRKYHHEQLTFSQLYAFSENFVLPLSHDEVVHGKKSLISKMAGDNWQKFANLRVLYAYHYAHPGKKLLFMGSELAQWNEWDSEAPLDWALADDAAHRGIMSLIADLNKLYRAQPALYCADFEAEGFEWIDCHDHEQSVLAFSRHGAGRQLICIFNFTPVVRHQYRIGVNHTGSYQEVLNTDSAHYNGSNRGNDGMTMTDDIAWMGRPHSLELTLPPLGALFLELDP